VYTLIVDLPFPTVSAYGSEQQQRDLSRYVIWVVMPTQFKWRFRSRRPCETSNESVAETS